MSVIFNAMPSYYVYSNTLYHAARLIKYFFSKQQLQKQVVRDVDEKLGIMVDELLREVNTFNLRNYQLRDLFRADSKELLSNRKYVSIW